MNPRLTVQGHLKLREVILPKVTLPGSGRAFGLQITKGDLSRMSLGQVTLHFDGLYYKMIQTFLIAQLSPLPKSIFFRVSVLWDTPEEPRIWVREVFLKKSNSTQDRHRV